MKSLFKYCLIFVALFTIYQSSAEAASKGSWDSISCFDDDHCPDGAKCEKVIPGGCKRGYCFCRKATGLKAMALRLLNLGDEKRVWSNGICIPLKYIGDECDTDRWRNGEELWVADAACNDGILGCPIETDEMVFRLVTVDGLQQCEGEHKPGYEIGLHIEIDGPCRFAPRDICQTGTYCYRPEGIFTPNGTCICTAGSTVVSDTVRELDVIPGVVTFVKKRMCAMKTKLVKRGDLCGWQRSTSTLRICEKDIACASCPEGGQNMCLDGAEAFTVSILVIFTMYIL